MNSYLSRRTLLTAATGSAAAALIATVVGMPSLPTARAAEPAGATAKPPAPADWSQWRGPYFDGSSPAKSLPTEFGPDKNLLWKATLPGNSNNTAVIAGDRIYTTAIDDSRKMICLALDKKDGKVLWQRDAGTAQLRPKGENDVAAPSPAADGKTVVFLFGTGDLLAFDPDGKPLWARNLQREIGEWNVNWIYGSSPLLYKGRLYVQVLHTDKPYKDTGLPGAIKYPGGESPSYLLALDPANGKELWRQIRPSEAVKETRESYGTPIPHTTAAGREEILLVGGDAVTGHDPETGKELWRFTGWDPAKEPFWRLIPSVVAGGGYVVACAPKGGPVMAIKEGGVGDVSATHKAWFSNGKEISSDVPVPLYYEGHFFVLDAGGAKLTKVEPATGKAVWQIKLEGPKSYARASPTGADGKVYCMNANGDVWVVNPADGKVLAKTSLGGNAKSAPARGSVAAVDGMLLIRVGDALYAFGEKP